ncbi:MAG: FAD-dependent oxidoreductase [Desulfobulbales bacterium]|nr:FAD-dependent oxidoreductase [Desulfobulbales bacterium]
MAKYDFDLGVLGGGAAGLTITAGGAQLGAKTLLVEKEPALGGDCLHYGCVPSKTLIRTARAYHEIKHAAKFGLPRVEVPPVDFQQVSQRIRSVIGVIQKHDSVERFCSLGARVEFGQPEFLDEHSIRLHNKTYSAKTWAIATGSSPAAPPFKGLDSVSYLTNKDIFSMDELPGSMIILGGGPIAIEMAQAFNRLGTRVTVIQRSRQILSREDTDLANMVMETLIREGVFFVLGSTIVSISEENGRKNVTFKNSEGNEDTLSAQALLVAMGRSPNVDGMGLEKIGIAHTSKGIDVDSRLRTNHKHIYAAGDITGKYQFTHAAGYEGGIVISNAIFHLPRKTDYTYLPWCTYTSPELASIGLNEKGAEAAGIKYSVWTEEFRNNDRSLAEGEEEGRIKMILDEKENPLGIQILGPRGGDLISEWVAVLNGKVKLSTLAGAVHPYPTLGEINKRVAGSFLSEKIFSDTVKKGLKFFFNLKGRACEL